MPGMTYRADMRPAAEPPVSPPDFNTAASHGLWFVRWASRAGGANDAGGQSIGSESLAIAELQKAAEAVGYALVKREPAAADAAPSDITMGP